MTRLAFAIPQTIAAMPRPASRERGNELNSNMPAPNETAFTDSVVEGVGWVIARWDR